MNLVETIDKNAKELDDLVGSYNVLIQQMQNAEAQRKALEVEILAKQRVIETLRDLVEADKKEDSPIVEE